MDKQRKAKKMLAIYFKKIVDGFATNEEILSFLDCAFSLSSLSEQIEQKPVVGLNDYLPKDEVHRVRGRYNKKELSFDISPTCLHDARYDKPGALLGLINTYGHEMTHHRQNEMNIENEFVPNAEQIRTACWFTGKELNEDVVRDLAFSYYYLCKSEIVARDGGIRFCDECLFYLNNSKHIHGKYKAKVQSLLKENSEMSKKEIDLGTNCQYKQNKLKEYLLSFDLDYFLKREKECVKAEDKNDLFNTFNLRVKLMNPEEVLEEFVKAKEKDYYDFIEILRQAVENAGLMDVTVYDESKRKVSCLSAEIQKRR